MRFKMRCVTNVFLNLLFLCSFTEIYTQTEDLPETWRLVFNGMDFPEGPAFDTNGNLYISNCYGGWIAKYDGSKIDTFLIKSDAFPSIDKTNGLVIVEDHIYACDYGIGAILKIIKDGRIEIISDGFDGEKFNRPNDIIFDGEENVYFTDPKGYGKDILDGRIFSLNIKTNELKMLADNLAFPNGLNISPLDNKLYVCESAKECIVRFEMDEEKRLVNKEHFITLPGGDPDGIEFDNDGNLYVSHFGGQAVYIISPIGEIIHKLDTPGKKPTNLEFKDSERKFLFLTEAETNSVYSIDLNNLNLK